MKILHTSDWHLDAHTAGYPRDRDIRKAVWETTNAAISNKVDYYLCTGDVCDPDNGGDSFGYAAFISQIAVHLADERIPSIWIPGNHDVVESGKGYTTLSGLRALSHSSRYGEYVHLYEEPRIVLNTSAIFVLLPFTSHDRTYDPARIVQQVKDIKDDLPIVIAGHLNLEEIEVGSETTDFPRGRDVFWPLDAIEELRKTRNVTCLAGHYHKRQVYRGVHVVGSLVNLTFGEEGNTPGYNIVEV